MKKKNVVLLTVVSFIASLGIGAFAATILNAKDVSYLPEKESWEVNNVSDALNGLYSIVNKGDATADNISLGKTAFVGGKLIVGNGKDVENNKSEAVVKTLTNYYTSEMTSYTYNTETSVHAYIARHNPRADYDNSYNTGPSKSGTSNPIYLYKTPDGKYGVVTAIIFNYTLGLGAEWQTPCTSNNSLTVDLYTQNGKLLDRLSFSNTTTSGTKVWTPSDYVIDDNSEYVYLKWSNYANVTISGDGRVNAESDLSNTTVKYIPLS